MLCFFACGSEKKIADDQKLYLTAKVWGFLKYYHPEVNKGQINWDNQLIEILRKLPTIKTNEELSALYLDWITSLGELAPCKNCESSIDQEYFDKNFDLSWLKDGLFTPELSDKLNLYRAEPVAHSTPCCPRWWEYPDHQRTRLQSLAMER